jgi:hypothetical protein
MASDDERRLYYVGMTRARELLLMCESVGATNPFSPRLSDPGITRLPLPQDIERPAALGWRYVSLGLADVDLSFAGRRPPGHAIHRALERLDTIHRCKRCKRCKGTRESNSAAQRTGSLSAPLQKTADFPPARSLP